MIDPHPPLVMDESKETATKRPLESSLPWMKNREEAEIEADYLNPIPKRSCTSRDGDTFEEFFALLQRIEKSHRYCSTTRNHLNRRESKASWRPSFEWEDFSSRGNGTRDVKSRISAVKACDMRVEDKEVVPHSSNNPKSGADLNPALEGLDLNSLPAGVPQFQ